MAQCWARSLYGCSGKISGEHVITRGVFADKEIGVKGLPWCREQHKFIPISAYTANILCTQHNSRLSPVDDAAIHGFNTLRTVMKVHEARKALLRERVWSGRFDVYDYTLDGEKLERWFLKTLINMEAVGKQLLPIGVPTAPVGEPPPELVEISFGLRKFQRGAGLYFAGREQEAVKTSERIRYVSMIKDLSHGEFVGAGEFSFYGLRFILCLEEEGLPATAMSQDGELRLIHHINGINVELNGQPSQRILFIWP